MPVILFKHRGEGGILIWLYFIQSPRTSTAKHVGADVQGVNVSGCFEKWNLVTTTITVTRGTVAYCSIESRIHYLVGVLLTSSSCKIAWACALLLEWYMYGIRSEHVCYPCATPDLPYFKTTQNTSHSLKQKLWTR